MASRLDAALGSLAALGQGLPKLGADFVGGQLSVDCPSCTYWYWGLSVEFPEEDGTCLRVKDAVFAALGPRNGGPCRCLRRNRP